MAQIAAHEDVKGGRTRRDVPGGYAWRTEFLMPPKDVFTEPHAYLAERSCGPIIRPHYHVIDQYQVIVSGGGVLGKHGLAIPAVHFARKYTPYGPIVAGKEGVGFLTLRPHRDTGASFLPESNQKLKNVRDRTPWQVTELPKFGGTGDVSVHAFSQIKADDGLAAFSLTLKPGAKTSAPDPSTSDGQYLVVTGGSLLYQGKDYRAITVIHVQANEPVFQLIAGAEGMQVLVLNFPRESVEAHKVNVPVAVRNAQFRVWQCQLCSFVYDEAQGMPHEGLCAGTRWEDVPDDWVCPDCSTGKADFQMEVAG